MGWMWQLGKSPEARRRAGSDGGGLLTTRFGALGCGVLAVARRGPVPSMGDPWDSVW